MDGGLLGVALAVLGSLGVGVVAVTAVSVALLRRRAAARPVSAGRASDALRAGSAIVAADDAVRDARDELAYAEAQFGTDAVRDFAAAVARARDELDRAFRLQGELGDPSRFGDELGPRRRADRERELRALAESARRRVTEQGARFSELRRAEASSPDGLARLRLEHDELTAAAAEAERRLDAMRAEYSPPALRGLDAELDAGRSSLAAAADELGRASAQLAGSAVPAVTALLDRAAAELRRARSGLGAVARRADELAAADAELARLRQAELAAVADARRVRDDPPDPGSAAEVNAAIAAVEPLLRAGGRPRDPLAELEALVAASDRLDIAVAAAHNEQRRLDGARAALSGALVAARSQIARASDAVSARRASVGSGARSRLAEAERELALAEAEADPVLALDGARRAATHARDAEALARY